MKKQDIIKIIEKYQAESSDLILRNWQFSAIADELLELIEQEKKEQAREILEKITSPVNTMTRLGYTQYVMYQNDIDKLAEEYGVKL